MRSTVFLFSLFGLVVPVVFAGAVFTAGGCADTAGLTDTNAKTAPGTPDEPIEGVESSTTDGGAKAATFGSPLCGVHEAACTPDNDGYDSCSNAPSQPDSGAPPPADAGTSAHACRIAAAGDGGAGSSCFDADRRGVDGVECRTGADCAPGFDCVEGDNGPVCRHYCCTGSCEGRTSQNGGATFCDIRKIVDGVRLNDDKRKAPVCMPLKKCMLLVEGECNREETCAVVTEMGDTGCVPNGTASAGTSCEYEQCAEGLTCLGNPGNRRCYKLCRTGGSDCPTPQVCTTGTIFQDTSYGVCKDPR